MTAYGPPISLLRRPPPSLQVYLGTIDKLIRNSDNCCHFSERVMTYNLFISFDLSSPDQNYDEVKNKIKSLGASYQFQRALFYLNTAIKPADIYSMLMSIMGSTDKLAVIDAKDGLVSTWDGPPLDAINDLWNPT